MGARSPALKLFTNSLEATFLARPNRFLILARHGGSTVTAHCPNPGKLLEVLIPGRRVILEQAAAANRKTWYRLVAAYYRGNVVPLYSLQANTIAEKLILPTLYPHSGPVKREVALGRSRLDFLIHTAGGETVCLEVKACTLVEETVAMFPDAPTLRGQKHLAELGRLAGRGYRPEVLFVIMNPEARSFVPNIHTDPAFSRMLIELKDKIQLRAISVRTDSRGKAVVHNPRLPVDLVLAEQNLVDSGLYLLNIRIRNRRTITPGSLGNLTLDPGYYVYVGSARRNLVARLKRHHRRRKNFRWHIDYLLDSADRVESFPIRSLKRLECALARDIASVASSLLPDFGSSDCACPSHLFYFAENPLHNEHFLALVLGYRHRIALGPNP